MEYSSNPWQKQLPQTQDSLAILPREMEYPATRLRAQSGLSTQPVFTRTSPMSALVNTLFGSGDGAEFCNISLLSHLLTPQKTVGAWWCAPSIRPLSQEEGRKTPVLVRNQPGLCSEILSQIKDWGWGVGRLSRWLSGYKHSLLLHRTWSPVHSS